ncbi:MAG: putative toxin-antitoxin system toxin component, PIN family [Verrucomicrobia bacterium]|nr:putative toxin-antitoxin system toxin component, PIN family [Verrucomicrobiota bacterium]
MFVAPREHGSRLRSGCRCHLLAKRTAPLLGRFRLFVSDPILAEYERIAWEIKTEERLTRDPAPALAWLKRKAKPVDPVSLPRRTCRDRKDDKFLECALAAQAEYLVSRDRDLLVLGRPFGIQVVTLRQFLSILAKR